VRDSQIQVYASRTTTFPLEHCNAENLQTAANFDRRRAAKYRKEAHKQGKRANAEWYEIAADALEALATKLKDGQTVGSLPYRKRRREMEMILRISTGKAR
jgi:hypothetical protein